MQGQYRQNALVLTNPINSRLVGNQKIGNFGEGFHGRMCQPRLSRGWESSSSSFYPQKTNPHHFFNEKSGALIALRQKSIHRPKQLMFFWPFLSICSV